MGKPDAPPPVDYAALAKQQGENSKDTAQFNTELNRVNQVTPWGSLTYSQTPTVDQSGYDAALAKYNAGNTQGTWVPPKDAYSDAGGDGGGNYHAAQEGYWTGATNSGGKAPDIKDYTKTAWTQTMNLSPEQQKLLDSNTAVSQKLADTGQTAVDNVSKVLGTPYDPSHLNPIQTSVGPLKNGIPTYGDMENKMTKGYTYGSIAAPVLDTAPVGSGGSYGGASGGAIRRDFDTSGVRAMPGNVDDASRKRVEEAIMSRLNPQYDRDQAMLRDRLLNSGIEVGTDAYNKEQANFSQRLNDARMAAVLSGGQEESRQVGLQQGLQAQEFNQALAKGNFGQTGDIAAGQQGIQAAGINAQSRAADNTAKINLYNAMLAAQGQDFGQHLLANQNEFGQKATSNKTEYDQALSNVNLNNQTHAQQLQQDMALRALPMNELSALRSGSQVTTPNFSQYYTGGKAADTPILDAGLATDKANQAAYQTEMTGYNAMMNGMANLGGSWLMKSDARLKTNLRQIGQHAAGVARYTWDWISGGGRGFGVLAQDLLAVRPDAVSADPSTGTLSVDYRAIGGF